MAWLILRPGSLGMLSSVTRWLEPSMELLRLRGKVGLLSVVDERSRDGGGGGIDRASNSS